MNTFKVAIDGPAGAGKSSIAKATAAKLKFVYIDTGAMYRAVGLAALRSGIEPNDAEAVAEILPQVDITISHDETGQRIFLCGDDVSEEIRKPEVSVAASDAAAIGAVREKLLELQRGIAEKSDVIMDGRDIGTHVLPNADVKIFLTASVEERARRRYCELVEKGADCDIEAVKRDIEYRDKNDSEREIAPLREAEDSVRVDTTGLSFEESVQKVLDIISVKMLHLS